MSLYDHLLFASCFLLSLVSLLAMSRPRTLSRDRWAFWSLVLASISGGVAVLRWIAHFFN